MPVLQFVSTIHKRVQDLLDHESSSAFQEISPQYFNSLKSEDEEELLQSLALSLPDSYEDRLVFLFTRLAQLFEVGVFIENSKANDESVAYVQAYFAFGQVKACADKNKIKKLRIPHTSPHEVLTIKAFPLLKKLALEKLDPEKRLTALVFQPCAEVSFILFSRKADLWLKPFAQKVLERINEGLVSE